jgi:hypothetical protein
MAPATGTPSLRPQERQAPETGVETRPILMPFVILRACLRRLAFLFSRI